VAQPKKKSTLPFARRLLLLLIPALWCLVSHLGWLDFFANRTMDWRFRARGELPTPIKVIYIDVDSRSVEEIGNFPWRRHYFARVADALVNVAHVRAVGFDFVLSPAGLVESADPEKIRASDLEIARFLRQAPPVVFGASYSAEEFRTSEGKITHRGLPLVASDPRAALVSFTGSSAVGRQIAGTVAGRRPPSDRDVEDQPCSCIVLASFTGFR